MRSGKRPDSIQRDSPWQGAYESLLVIRGSVCGVRPWLSRFAGHDEQVFVRYLDGAFRRASVRTPDELEKVPIKSGRPIRLTSQARVDGYHGPERLLE